MLHIDVCAGMMVVVAKTDSDLLLYVCMWRSVSLMVFFCFFFIEKYTRKRIACVHFQVFFWWWSSHIYTTTDANQNLNQNHSIKKTHWTSFLITSRNVKIVANISNIRFIPFKQENFLELFRNLITAAFLIYGQWSIEYICN